MVIPFYCWREKIHLKLEKLRAAHGEKKSEEVWRNFKRSGVKPLPPSYMCQSPPPTPPPHPQFEIAYSHFQLKES